MRLTSFTDYSLRVLMYLAVQPAKRATIAQIAAAFAVSEHHLTKVVHFLGKQGWLANVRGKGGGLELGRAAHDIVVGHVVRETEGPAQVAECFGEVASACQIAPVCRLRGALAQAVDAFYLVLDGYTVADLAGNRQELATVLFPDLVAPDRPALETA